LVGSIYGRSSIKIAHFVSIREKIWPPQAILLSDWLISKKIFPSDTAWPMNQNRGEDFLEINQSETKMARGGHVC
jgi:hypothetical protein